MSLLFVSGHGNGTDFSLWWDSVKHNLKGHHVYFSLELAKVNQNWTQTINPQTLRLMFITLKQDHWNWIRKPSPRRPEQGFVKVHRFCS